MNARSVLPWAVFFGLGAGVLPGAEPQAPPLVYELTVDGQTVDLKESEAVEISVGDKTVRATVRLKPIQHYATETIGFAYDKSFSLRDDFDRESRTLTLMHGSTASLVIMELGEAGAGGPRPTLARLAEQMETSFKRGVCRDLKTSPEVSVPFKNAAGVATTLTYKDEDDDERTCRIYVLESKGQRFSVVVQFGAEEKDLAESLAKITLGSIGAK